MGWTAKAVLVGVTGVGGALLLLALTVYPFRYGIVESSVPAGAFVLLSLYEVALDEATFGTDRER